MRFEPKLNFEVVLDPKINAETVRLPPLLVQQFVENAIWHGLMNKKGGGSGRVEFRLDRPNKLLIIIEDDGVGRKKLEKSRPIQPSKRNRTASKSRWIASDRSII